MLAPFLKLSTDNPLPPSIKAESLYNELLSIYRGMPSNEIQVTNSKSLGEKIVRTVAEVLKNDKSLYTMEKKT